MMEGVVVTLKMVIVVQVIMMEEVTLLLSCWSCGNPSELPIPTMLVGFLKTEIVLTVDCCDWDTQGLPISAKGLGF